MDRPPRRELSRREFLARSGRVAGGGALAGIAPVPRLAGIAPVPRLAGRTRRRPPLFGWDDVRAQFELDPSYIHFSAFRFASHPKPVRDAIDRHRRNLDRNTHVYLDQNGPGLQQAVLNEAAAYLGADPVDIALTDSTTMGLGILYGGISLRADQEIVATEHDFYPTHEAIRLRAERTGASWRKIALFADVRTVTEAEILDNVRAGVSDKTRVLAITYVHSSTGLKLPVRAIADVVAEINSSRPDQDQVILCVDGVHGIGAEAAGVTDLGCDFISFGSHKWLFGPRGTGVFWGNPNRWPLALGTIPTFDPRSLQAWIEGHDPTNVPPAAMMTPGGFHSFEHRWALADAFAFQSRIGKQRVQDRVHQLATQLKQGLAAMSHVTLYTPMSDTLSAGIVCFSVDGYTPDQVVDRLLVDFRILASTTPYAFELVRIGTTIINTPNEVDQALAAIASLS